MGYDTTDQQDDIVRAMRDLGDRLSVIPIRRREQWLAVALGLPDDHCRELLDNIQRAREEWVNAAPAAAEDDPNPDDLVGVPDLHEGV